jgi:hypothetical protein
VGSLSGSDCALFLKELAGLSLHLRHMIRLFPLSIREQNICRVYSQGRSQDLGSEIYLCFNSKDDEPERLLPDLLTAGLTTFAQAVWCGLSTPHVRRSARDFWPSLLEYSLIYVFILVIYRWPRTLSTLCTCESQAALFHGPRGFCITRSSMLWQSFSTCARKI